MSVEGHVETLKAKHEHLEAKIQEAENNLAIDDLEVAEMKKEKLRIKDQLHELGATD